LGGSDWNSDWETDWKTDWKTDWDSFGFGSNAGAPMDYYYSY